MTTTQRPRTALSCLCALLAATLSAVGLGSRQRVTAALQSALRCIVRAWDALLVRLDRAQRRFAGAVEGLTCGRDNRRVAGTIRPRLVAA